MNTDEDISKEAFLEKYYNAVKNDSGLNLLSISQLSEYTKNLFDEGIDKDAYCERTYVKPRLKRVPDKLKFLDDLINTFEEIIQKDFEHNFEEWSSGEYYFLTADGQFDLTVTDEGDLIADRDQWFNHYQTILETIYNDKLLDFLDELRYLIYLKNEKKELLQNEIDATQTKEMTKHVKASAFIVHGRDNEAKQTVARYLEHLEIKPIILSEQGGIKGILDKIEYCSEVDFAIVLLTPDDEGCLKGEPLKDRARQNVIFELGYFISKLKKDKVFVLVKGDVEKPSDYDGIMYIAYDTHSGWKLNLAKEIKTIGIDIDLNKAIN